MILEVRKGDTILFMMEDSRLCLFVSGNDLAEEEITKAEKAIRTSRRGDDTQRRGVGICF